MPAEASSYRVTSDTGKEITVSVRDISEALVRSPLLTEAFVKAIVNVVPKAVAGAVREIVVTIGDTANEIEFQLHVQRVALNAAKLRATTDIFATAVASADRAEYPESMRDELKERLYEVFYAEMEHIVEGLY